MQIYSFDSENHLHYLVENGEKKHLIGTTTALSVIEKPLTWWASGCAVQEFGWLNPKKNDPKDCENAAKGGLALVKALDLKEYRALLDRAYRAFNTFKKKRADEGVDLHALIAQWIRGTMEFEANQPVSKEIEPFVVWAKSNVKKFIASEIHCYSSRLWTGGIVDLIYEDKEENIVVGDIKSAKDAYFNHFVQVGAYSLMLMENGGFDSNGKKLLDSLKHIEYVSIFPMGQKEFKEPAINENVSEMGQAFESALALYKTRQRFENGGYGYDISAH